MKIIDISDIDLELLEIADDIDEDDIWVDDMFLRDYWYEDYEEEAIDGLFDTAKKVNPEFITTIMHI